MLFIIISLSIAIALGALAVRVSIQESKRINAIENDSQISIGDLVKFVDVPVIRVTNIERSDWGHFVISGNDDLGLCQTTCSENDEFVLWS